MFYIQKRRRLSLEASDIGLGCASVPVVFLLALFTGGFNFWLPWLLCSLALFGCGWISARHPSDSVWRKALGINLSWLLLTLATVGGPSWLIVLIALGTLVPTFCGIGLRTRNSSAARWVIVAVAMVASALLVARVADILFPPRLSVR